VTCVDAKFPTPCHPDFVPFSCHSLKHAAGLDFGSALLKCVHLIRPRRDDDLDGSKSRASHLVAKVAIGCHGSAMLNYFERDVKGAVNDFVRR
jgi:hypothetical protein